jgi:hypothetical protein
MKLTNSAEYNTRKRVSEYKFQDTGDKQQKTTKEHDRATLFVNSASINENFSFYLHKGNPVSTGTSPGHQAA